MGSLGSMVMAVTVTANAPAGLDGAVVKVRMERPPMAVAGGENDAVTPLGSPLTLRFTGVPYRSPVARNETIVLVRWPARTVADGELSSMV